MTNPILIRMPCRRDNLADSVMAKQDSKAKQQVATIIVMDHAETCGIV